MVTVGKWGMRKYAKHKVKQFHYVKKQKILQQLYYPTAGKRFISSLKVPFVGAK